MGVQVLLSWMAANKTMAAITAVAVVAAGGSAVAAASGDGGPPTVEVEALDTEQVAGHADEPMAAPEEEPDPAPTKERDEHAGDERKDTAPVDTADGQADDKPDGHAHDEPDGNADDKPGDTTGSGVDLAVSVSGTSDRTVVEVHNLGDAVSGPVKVKYAAHDGAAGVVRVLEASSNATECGTWYCWFDGLAPGVAMATVVFEVAEVACKTAEGGGKVTAHYEGDDRTWDNNYARVVWCEGEQLAGAADLGVHVAGTPEEYVVTVDNAGPSATGQVKVKMHSMDGASGTIRVLGTSGPAVSCDGWYCYFQGIPVGEGVATVRFAVDVHECWSAEGGATVEVRSEADPDPANDRRWVPWCEGHDVTEKATTDLAVSIEGTAASYQVLVANTSGQAAADVHLLHRTKEGETTLTLLETSHPDRCGVEGCTLAELPPGASIWIRIEASVDCATSPATFAKAYVETTSKDTTDDNDWATLELC